VKRRMQKVKEEKKKGHETELIWPRNIQSSIFWVITFLHLGPLSWEL
jgi:hypothetical protein